MGQMHFQSTLDSAKPLCGRQLRNSRDTREQHGRDLALTGDPTIMLLALLDEKACRHCAQRLGLLVKPTYEIDGESEDE